MQGPRWSDVLRESGFVFVGNALFPKLAHRLRWPSRLAPRGLVRVADPAPPA
jgi:hypothetical protein